MVGLSNGSACVGPIWPTPTQTSDIWTIQHGAHAVRSVAFCPDFATLVSNAQSVCSGGEDGRLVLQKRSGSAGRTLLHSGEGPVGQVAWRDSFIAWSNALGAKIINSASGQKVSFIPRPESEALTSRCNLKWASALRLLISWGQTIRVVVVRQGTETELFYGEIQRTIRCLGTVCGLAPASDQNILALVADGHGYALQLCGQSATEKQQAAICHSELLDLPRALCTDVVHLVCAGENLP
eukprot:3032150-Amphidinium_carterae.1